MFTGQSVQQYTGCRHVIHHLGNKGTNNGTTGDTVFIGITWHTDAETPCTAELRPNFISVACAGSLHIIDSGASTGLSSNDENNNLEASATNASSMKIYKITPPDGVTDLKSLDVINLVFSDRLTIVMIPAPEKSLFKVLQLVHC